MKITAKQCAYSSVVGGGVLLMNEKGHMIGQLAFICHDATLRDKDLQIRLGETITNAINADAGGKGGV